MDAKNELAALTPSSHIDDIARIAFRILGNLRWVPVSTVNPRTGGPENRILDLNLLADGRIYFVVAKGKKVYSQIKESGRIAVTGFDGKDTVMGVMVRVNAVVEEINDPDISKAFYAVNRGTEDLYRNCPDALRMFVLASGQGEIFYPYEWNKLIKFPFAFGGSSPVSQLYSITEDCTECGACTEACINMPEAIIPGSPYKIAPNYCIECGACFDACLLKAVVRKEE